METRYDGYYEREIAYKMTLEELQEYAKAHNGHMGEEHILAYIRFKGEGFTCMAHAAPAESIMPTPFGFALTSEKKSGILCKIMLRESNLYNPLKEDHDILHENHWYNPYKIEYTPVEYQGCVEKMYFSDFCHHINQGYITLL